MLTLSEIVVPLLQCPHSGEDIILENEKISTKSGSFIYPVNSKGQPDFRLQAPTVKSITIQLPDTILTQVNSVYQSRLKLNPAPVTNFDGFKIPHHLSKELLSYFPAGKPGSIALDLGCGTALHKQTLIHAGFTYIGIDYSNAGADILGDAHALPFKDNTFDFIISIAVLEHIQHPYIMMKEVQRVLKPGGKIIGSVSFMEPFHDNSFYHHSHLGVLNTLHVAGLAPTFIVPNTSWDALDALADMHYFSTLPIGLQKFIAMPYKILSDIWWAWNRLIKKGHWHPFSDTYKKTASAGAFYFIAEKK